MCRTASATAITASAPAPWPDCRADDVLCQDPTAVNSIPGIVERRAALMQLLAAMEVPPNLNVNSEDRMVPGPEGAPDVRVRVYRPAAASGPLPGIYCIHGGGMILGDIEGEGAAASAICDQVGAVGVSVDYRLAPEHPHPAPVEDCYAGLTWMARNAAEPRGSLTSASGTGPTTSRPGRGFSATASPTSTPRPPGPKTCPACRRPSSMWAPLTCSGTRTLPSRCG